MKGARGILSREELIVDVDKAALTINRNVICFRELAAMLNKARGLILDGLEREKYEVKAKEIQAENEHLRDSDLKMSQKNRSQRETIKTLRAENKLMRGLLTEKEKAAP